MQARKNGQELLVVIHDFYLFEESFPVYRHLRADFYLGTSGSYRPYRFIDTLIETTGGRWSSISYEFFDLFQQACGARPGADGETYTLHEAAGRLSRQRQAHPVYEADSFRGGVYATLKEFLAHKPTWPQFVRITSLKAQAPTDLISDC